MQQYIYIQKVYRIYTYIYIYIHIIHIYIYIYTLCIYIYIIYIYIHIHILYTYRFYIYIYIQSLFNWTESGKWARRREQLPLRFEWCLGKLKPPEMERG